MFYLRLIAFCFCLLAGSVHAQVSPGTSPLSIAKGGTGAATAAAARTNLGLGTGLNIIASSALATAAVLPNTPTYANGTAGVGATLTAASNTTLTVDGTAAPLNTVVLVKNQASAFQNGIYTVTQAGSGSVPWILTRANYFDQASEMTAGSYTFITSGTANLNSSYTLQTAVTTVGTDPSNWALFSASAGNVVGTGSSAIGNFPSFSNTTTNGIVDSGVSPNSIPGLVPTTSTVTITIATPGVVTWPAHGLKANATVYFTTTGGLPTGLTASVPANSTPTAYYVVGASITTNTFQVATTRANAIANVPVNTSSVQSGTHTAFANAVACAGCLGEEIYNVTPITNANVTSGADTVFNTLTLPIGVFRVTGSAGVFGTGGSSVFNTNHASLGLGISAICTTPFCGTTDLHVASNNSNGWLFTFNPVTIPVFSSSSLNAVCEPVFSGGTATCFGELRAIRVR